MNLDELMTIWKSQDVAPLHDVNQTALRQALREDEARLQKARRRERRIHYTASAFVIGLLALLLTLMIHGHRSYVLTGWDYVMGIGGAASALLAGGLMYSEYRAQTRHEQRSGDSLRDQINRRLAQADGVITGVRLRIVKFMLMGMICPIAVLHLGMRVNHKSLADVRPVVVFLVFWCLWTGARALRRSVQHATARKRELAALLKELDAQ